MNAAMPLPAAAPTTEELIAALPTYSTVLMRKVFLRRHVDQDDAQDLLQQTFLAVLTKLRAGGLEDPANFGGYLYRTAWHLTTDYWRTKRRSPHIESSDQVLHGLADDSVGPEEALQRAQVGRSVRHAIRQLPVRRDREVLERLYVRDESRVSIRESMELNELQFNNVVWRAQGRLALTYTNVGSAATHAQAAARRSWGQP